MTTKWLICGVLILTGSPALAARTLPLGPVVQLQTQSVDAHSIGLWGQESVSDRPVMRLAGER
jgi:hypothetical protein